MDLPGILLQTPIFRDLTRDDVAELVPHLTERRYGAGEAIWFEGDPVDALWVLAEGTIKSHRLSRDGAEVIVDINEAVDITGEVGLFHASGVRQVNVTAIKECRFLLLRRAPLVAFLSRHPPALERMLEQLSGLTVRAAYSFTGMVFDDIRARAARTLLALADEFGEPVDGGVRVRLQLSQRTLGALAAASRENINRALAPLVADGVISQQDGHFVVHDRARLEAVAEAAGSL
ncbi:Crp/Fnr family transcriptional regulator [Nocardioides humilatus]|uniref:Crp/Fnr family transcriptional regulator n=1 Tax=Nocardioides humilatus TaxID=2607660 RepID=A0A5B1LF20_9ACTN|nr:Crp/Fnr family transcriptional regulator [Nocardioides humilatus]KAA1419331.1 Crp/Fnr family transcriptional regulator [Nocardioides humilatus]